MGKRSASGITSGGGRGTSGSSSSGGSLRSSVSAVGGSASSVNMAAQPPQPVQQQPQQPPQPKNVAPTSTGSAFDALQKMSDDELANVVRQSKSVSMPNQLADIDDVTQKFVYQAGLNEKPQVLASKDFDNFVKQNNIKSSELLARSVDGITYKNASGTNVKMTADDVADMMMYSKYNYIGGKVNGQALGAGMYFMQNGGRPTGYGPKTVVAALNPATARITTPSELRRKASSFAKSHPKFAKAVGPLNESFSGGKNNMAIYALAMGYNVIWDAGGGGRTNVIDRSVLVYRK